MVTGYWILNTDGSAVGIRMCKRMNEWNEWRMRINCVADKET